MATTPPLRLNRDQLAQFLPDHESIRQFENLFQIVQSIAPNVPDELQTAVGSASASAENAIALLTQLAQDIAVTQSVIDAKAGQALSTAEQTKRDLGVLLTKPEAELPNSLTFDYVDFRTNPAYVQKTGRLAWNNSDQTLDLDMEYGVTQQIGQEQYARVGNTTGVTIPNGTVVGFAGATSDALLVAPYLADGSQPTLYILGVMTHDLPDSGDKGYCTTWGFVRGIDTSAFSAGDILYPSPTVAGALTNVKPTAPDNVIPVAACVVSDATNGVIFVRPTIEQQKYYGSFSKTTNQAPVAINTEYLLTFDNTELANGISIGTPASRIVVSESGLYDFSATMQLTSGNSSDKNVWVFFKKNGTAIANTSRLITVNTNGGYAPISVSEFFSLNANDYIEIAFAANNTNVAFNTLAATAFAPAAPSALLTVTQVQQ